MPNFVSICDIIKMKKSYCPPHRFLIEWLYHQSLSKQISHFEPVRPQITYKLTLSLQCFFRKCTVNRKLYRLIHRCKIRLICVQKTSLNRYLNKYHLIEWPHWEWIRLYVLRGLIKSAYKENFSDVHWSELGIPFGDNWNPKVIQQIDIWLRLGNLIALDYCNVPHDRLWNKGKYIALDQTIN